MSSEEWRPVPGWEGLYSVSSLGRVRSEARIMTRSDGRHARPVRERILRPVLNNGYHKVALCGRGMSTQALVHRLVMLAFFGPAPTSQEVCHGDGSGTNNRLDNLRYGTPAENAADMVLHGTASRGERHGAAKLTRDDVLKIRAALSEHVPHREIAGRYGVTKGAITAIATGRNWAWLVAEPAQ